MITDYIYGVLLKITSGTIFFHVIESFKSTFRKMRPSHVVTGWLNFTLTLHPPSQLEASSRRARSRS